ncbi:MAG: hypothetical protein HY075_12850, partial [Deltaproteobacteria bacterium]|nr:hypothetical protein [Deltaproteobacteria bacterium]
CELGFDVLAWEDRDHGPETAGLATWLRLSRGSVLHSSDDVTLFDLRCSSSLGPEPARSSN